MQAKTLKAQDKIRWICNRIGRTCMETVPPFSKTIATSELTDRIYDKTKKPSVMAAKICNAIGVFYEPTAWISVETVTIFEWIDVIGNRIDTT
jgi:hypothetical protein